MANGTLAVRDVIQTILPTPFDTKILKTHQYWGAGQHLGTIGGICTKAAILSKLMGAAYACRCCLCNICAMFAVADII